MFRPRAARPDPRRLPRRAPHLAFALLGVHALARVPRREREPVDRFAESHDHLIGADVRALDAHQRVDHRARDLLARFGRATRLG